MSSPLTVTLDSVSSKILSMVGGAIGETRQGGISGAPVGYGAQIVYTGTTGDIMLLQSTTNAGNTELVFYCENMTFVGNKAGGTTGGGLHFKCIRGDAKIRTVLQHVNVMNCKDDGIWIDGSHNAQWLDVQSNDNGGRGFYISQQTGPAISPESRFVDLTAYSNGGKGFEAAANAGLSNVWGLTCINNIGQDVVLNTGGWRIWALEVEHSAGSGVSPYIDLLGPGIALFGVQVVYGNTTDHGIRFSSYSGLVSSVNTNSANNQIDFEFTAASNWNTVTGWLPGDSIVNATHVSDAANNNLVQAGRMMIGGAAYEVTGAGSAALGANCPAATLTAPYKWLKWETTDQSVVYIPVWK